jgi:hypothetical protein
VPALWSTSGRSAAVVICLGSFAPRRIPPARPRCAEEAPASSALLVELRRRVIVLRSGVCAVARIDDSRSKATCEQSRLLVILAGITLAESL